MSIQMDNIGPALTEADIARFEARINYILPSPYKKFLLQHNGGRPDPYHFDIAGWSDNPAAVNDFDGIIPGAYNDIDRHFQALRMRLPKGFIPIADDPGGNAVLLSLTGDSVGKIYFWDHERQPYDGGDDLSGYPNIFFVADDFAKFLQLLKE